jgi:hypothetical protein
MAADSAESSAAVAARPGVSDAMGRPAANANHSTNLLRDAMGPAAMTVAAPEETAGVEATAVDSAGATTGIAALASRLRQWWPD